MLGAGGYQVTFYNIDDPDNPVVIGEENEVVDKCTITRDITEDTKYKVAVRALGNQKYNNACLLYTSLSIMWQNWLLMVD